MGVWKNIIGLIGNTLQMNFTGPKIVGSSTDTVTITSSTDGDGKLVSVAANHESIEVYDGTSRTTTITMAGSGGGDITLVLPNNDGDANNALTTDGSGNLSWTDLDSVAAKILTLNFGDGAEQSLAPSVAARYIDRIIIKVTEVFDNDATPATVEIGITGTTGKYVATTDVDLGTVGIYSVDVANYESGAEELLATFVAGSAASTGIAEIVLVQCFPTVTA